MNLEELTIDLNTPEFCAILADGVLEILSSENMLDETSLHFIEQLRGGKLSFPACLDQLVEHMKNSQPC